MVGPSFDSKGGIASVINAYRAAGLFDHWGILYITTHCDKNILHKLLIVIKSYIKFVALLAGGRIGLLHAHVASRSSFLRKSMFILLALAARKPVIFHLHGGKFVQYYDEGSIVRKWLVRFILDHCAVVAGLSSSWQVNLTKITKNKNIVCIPNPILLQGPGKLLLAREPHTLLFLGRLQREKGIYELLDAMAKLSLQFLNIRLFAGGDGNSKELTEHACRLGIIDKITFLGWVQGSRKADLLARATVFVLPSYNEGLPVGILEAMAVGLPVISTTVGGIPDAVENGVEGLLIAPRNVDALVAAIAKLLRNPELRQQMGEAAVRKARDQFSSDKVIRRLETLYAKFGAMPVSAENLANLHDM